MRPLFRALPALLATLSLTLQPLAAQERYYFRNVSPGAAGITIPIPNPNLDPEVSLGSAFSYAAGAPVSIAPTAINFASSPIWSVSPSLRSGLFLDAVTGTISGSSSVPGTTSHVLTASAAGKTAAAGFSLTINPPSANPPQVADYATTYTFVAGEPLAIPAPSVTGGIGSLAFSLSPGSLPFSIAPSNGQISWQSPVAGSWPGVVVIARDETEAAGSSNPFSIVVNPALSAGSYGATKEMMVGDQRAFSLTGAQGGRGALSFALNAGALPGGFQIQPDGSVAGTATAAGEASATVRVSDADGRQADATFASVVYAPLALVPPQIPAETIAGSSYPAIPLMATGGKQPHAFELSGTVPSGVSVNGQSLSLAPTVAGPYAFSLTVRDAYSPQNSDTRLVSTTVLAAPVATASVPSTLGLNQPIEPVTLQVSGGKAPYSWSTTGNLPPGLTFVGGVLSGQPTQAGTFSFALVATESLEGRTASSGPTSVTVENLQMVVAPTTVFPGILAVGSTVAVDFQASAGTAPYSYAVSSGTLPPGLTLDASTGRVSGKVSGSGAGTSHSFEITATDSHASPRTASYGPVAPYVQDQNPIALNYATGTYEGSVGQSLSVPAPTLTGGVAPYAFSSTPALTFAANGSTAFTSPTEGTFEHTVTVTDADGRIRTAPLRLVIKSPPLIASTGFPSATQGQPNYSAALAASGGTGPYTWTLKQGATTIAHNAAIGNSGIIWRTNGTLVATSVAATGTSQANLTLSLVDSAGRASATVGPFTLNVSARPSAPTYTSSLQTTAGIASTINPSAASVGGVAPLTYGWATAPSDTANITIDPATGVIAVAAGLPNTGSNYVVSVAVTDANGVTGNASGSISLIHRDAPTIATASLPNATQGMSYSQSLSATGGSGLSGGWTLTNNGVAVTNGTQIGTTGLTWNSGSATISGTVSFTADTLPNLTFGYKDSANRQAAPRTLALGVNLAPRTPAYAATSAQVNVAKTVMPSTTSIGGSGAITYEITSVTPAGAGITMANSSTGEVAINVATAGSYSAVIRARDAAGTYSSGSATLSVNATAAVAPYLTTSSFTPGQYYSSAVRATGGSGTFGTSAYRITYNGTTLNSTSSNAGQIGYISGLGSFYYDLSWGSTTALTAKSQIGIQVRATDNLGNVGNATVNLLANLIRPTYPASASTTSGTAIGINPTAPAYGGTGTLSYSVASSPYSGAITVNSSTGAIAIGAGVAAGTYSVTVTATDGGVPSVGSITSSAVTVSVAAPPPPPPPPTITSTMSLSPTTGQAVSYQLQATGGGGALTWSVSGYKPAWVSVSPSGLISGTPNYAGTEGFYVTVTGPSGSDTKIFYMFVQDNSQSPG